MNFFSGHRPGKKRMKRWVVKWKPSKTESCNPLCEEVMKLVFCVLINLIGTQEIPYSPPISKGFIIQKQD